MKTVSAETQTALENLVQVASDSSIVYVLNTLAEECKKIGSQSGIIMAIEAAHGLSMTDEQRQLGISMAECLGALIDYGAA